MATEASFLQAIEESPYDPANYLVFADWLEEQGEEVRASFIRVSCELARRDPDWDTDHAMLLARHDRIWNEHSDDWTTRNRKKYGNGADRVYRRGVPTGIEIQDLKEVLKKPGTALASPLVVVKADLSSDTNNDFFKLKALPRVSELDLHHLVDAGAEAMAGADLGRLRKLTLSNPMLSPEQLEALLRAPFMDQLTDLTLDNLPDSNSALFRRERPANLRRLHLRNSSLAAESTRALFSSAWAGLTEILLDVAHDPRIYREGLASEHLHSLEVLTIDSNAGVGTGDAAALLRNKSLAKLRKLHLRGLSGKPDNSIAEALAECDLPALQYLDLSHNQFGVAVAEALARSPLAPRLVGLNLGDCGKLKKAGALALAKGDFSSLRRLDVGSIGMGHDGLKALLDAPWMGNVEWLDIGNNNLKAPAGKLLAGSPNLAKLRGLDLAVNYLGDKGLIPLLQSENLPALEALDLAATHLGGKAIEALAEAPLLDKLVVLMLNLNDENMEQEAPLMLGESGRCEKLQSIWWDWFDIDDDPEAQEQVNEAFGPGVFDFYRFYND